MAQPGSAPAWHAGGQGFESPWIHHELEILQVAESSASNNNR